MPILSFHHRYFFPTMYLLVMSPTSASALLLSLITSVFCINFSSVPGQQCNVSAVWPWQMIFVSWTGQITRYYDQCKLQILVRSVQPQRKQHEVSGPRTIIERVVSTSPNQVCSSKVRSPRCGRYGMTRDYNRRVNIPQMRTMLLASRSYDVFSPTNRRSGGFHITKRGVFVIYFPRKRVRS